MPYTTDPISGERVWVDPSTGQVALRSKGGAIYNVTAEGAGDAILSGEYAPASAEDVATYDQEKEAREAPLGERALTAAEGAAAGLMDVPLGAAKLAALSPAQLAIGYGSKALARQVGVAEPPTTFEALAPVTGRETMAGVAGLSQEVFGDPMEQTGEATAEKYEREMREREKRNPWSALGGRLAGEMVATGGLGAAVAPVAAAGRGLSLATKLGIGAAEGAVLGASMDAEQAFIQDREQTVESTLAATGLGAVLGGTVAMGIHGLGKAKEYAPRLFQRVGRGRYVSRTDAAPHTPTQNTDALQNMAEQRLGQQLPPDTGKLIQGALDNQAGDMFERAVQAEAGRSGSTVSKARDVVYDMWRRQFNLSDEQFQALKTAGPGTFTPEAKAWRKAHREVNEVTERATRESIDSTNVLLDRSNTVTRHVVEPELNRAAVARNLKPLSPAQHSAAKDAALAEFDNLQTAYGTALGRSRAAVLGEESAATRAAVTTGRGAKTLRGNAVEVSRLRTAAAEGTSADAYAALEHAKRITQNWVDDAGKGFRQIKSADERATARFRIETLEPAQERARRNLMSETLWGAQGAAQKAKNASWERYIAARKNFGKAFATEVGEEYGGFGGHRLYEARPGSVHSLFKGLGTFEQEHAERFLREFVDATDELTATIGGRYAKVGEDAAAAAALQEMGVAAKTVRKVLKESSDTIKQANAVKSLMGQLEKGGIGISGAALAGTFLGGPVGTAVGATVGLAANPAHLMRTVSGVEAMRVMSRLNATSDAVGRKLMSGTDDGMAALSKLGKQEARVAKAAGKEATEQAPGETRALGAGSSRRLATAMIRSGFQDRDETKRDAYKRRAQELLAWQSRPEESAAKVAASLSGLQHAAPKLANQLALKANMGAGWLMQKLPAGVINLDTFTPHLEEPSVNDREIERFAEYWSGANAPLTLLEDLKDGTLTREKVEAVKALYPRIFRAIQFRVMDRLSQLKEPPPYQARLRLDLLLDLNGRAERSVSPTFLARGLQLDQQRQSELQQQQEAQRQRTATPDFASAAQTTSGAIAAMTSQQ